MHNMSKCMPKTLGFHIQVFLMKKTIFEVVTKSNYNIYGNDTNTTMLRAGHIYQLDHWMSFRPAFWGLKTVRSKFRQHTTYYMGP